MKKSFKIILVASLIFMLAGCGSKDDKKTVEVIAKGFTQQYWTAVKNGSEKAAEELDVKLNFVGPANETAIQEQVQMLGNAINKKPSAIALASLDTNSQIDLLNQAKSQEIPIIGFDSGVPSAPEGTVQATAATNNKLAAGLAAEKIFEALEEDLKEASVENQIRIGILSQEVNSQSISDRTEGFMETMIELSKTLDNISDNIAVIGHEKFANDVKEKDAVLIIQIQVPANATDSEVQTAGQVLLNKENIKAVFTSNETATKGLLNANDSVGGVLGKTVIGAGFDSGKMQKEAVKSGTLLGSVTQDPITIGYNAVKLAVAASNGEKVEDMDIPAAWYNSDNIDSEEISALLYD